ncbi:hypothetical protein BOX37_30900 [Nocardia mangyaensis]|uniref:Uncharacterized protein n=1 Tax=Nocardia mangyaensis TaxID=2213200 RepID=A0A1J0VZT6_9NOCA|nr:hypothetical protein [Nocardia mangyaensis]APE37608.1 hypothetical protein BOX37_30900 [Nocardia mangyaensis]
MTGTTPYATLVAKARAGEVYLNDEAAAYHMYKACDTRLSDLQGLLDITQRVRNVTGFGDFDMAKTLESKFRSQAVGEPNSIYEVILKDIDAVKDLREVFSISFKSITGKDIENASALDYTTGQV